MNEFGYLKPGDKCYIWNSLLNDTTEHIVTCRVPTKIDAGNLTLRLDDGMALTEGYGHCRLVHAPFKAEFPPKPKVKVVKEGSEWQTVIHRGQRIRVKSRSKGPARHGHCPACRHGQSAEAGEGTHLEGTVEHPD